MKRSILIVMMMTTSRLAVGGDAADKEAMKESDKETAEGLRMTNELCGTSIKASIDWASFKTAPKNGDFSFGSVGGDCKDVLLSVRGVCGETESFKKAVQSKVKSVVCRYDKTATRERLKRSGGDLTLNAGKLVMGYIWGTANVGPEAKLSLEKIL